MKKDVIKAAPVTVTCRFQADECVPLDGLVKMYHSSRSAVIRMAVEAMAAAHLSRPDVVPALPKKCA